MIDYPSLRNPHVKTIEFDSELARDQRERESEGYSIEIPARGYLDLPRATVAFLVWLNWFVVVLYL